MTNKTDVQKNGSSWGRIMEHLTSLVLLALVASAAALGYLYGGTEALHSTGVALYIPAGAALGAIVLGSIRFIVGRSI